MSNIRLLIFSDLDGTLLDHHSYSHAAADDMLAKLNQLGIPIIPCTSKTRAEVERLRSELKHIDPFIVENGAAVYFPQHYFHAEIDSVLPRETFLVKQFVKPRTYWQALLTKLDTNLQKEFISFQQAGIDGITEMTGLPRSEAILAAQREYGEPLQWRGNSHSYAEFEKQMHASGATILKGGRFVHVSGATDKGRALRWLKQRYAEQTPNRKIVTVALGDSQNDVAMLEEADHAVIIKSPVQPAPVFHTRENQDVYQTKACGPDGWVEAVTRILSNYHIKTK